MEPLLFVMASVDNVEFKNNASPVPYEKNGEQVGWIYKISSEFQQPNGKWKRYKGNAFVKIIGEIVPFKF